MRVIRRCSIALALGLAAALGNQAADPPAGWKLTWADEFDGTAIDRTKWDFDLGNGFYDYDAGQWRTG